MPANLDESQHQVILTVTTLWSIIVLGYMVYTEFIEIPRLTKLLQQQQLIIQQQQHQQQQPKHKKSQKQSIEAGNNHDGSKNHNECGILLLLLYGCLKSFFFMLLSTIVLTYPILCIDNQHAVEDSKRLPSSSGSSINFCESDFRHTRYMAEPVNTISSITAYLPVAVVGIVRSTTRLRYLVCYTTVFMIGIGSTLLHSSLTAFTQGGDELPMLWYTAATSYCAFDVIFSGLRGVGTVVSLTAIVSTIVYVRFRANFTYFYLMFSAYTITLTFSLLHMTLFMRWEKRSDGVDFKRRILLPLTRLICVVVVAAVWIWVAEMLGCESATNQTTDSVMWFVWNRVLHPLWHFTSAMVAFLLVQVIYAAEGFSKGWGVPSIVWVGVPFVEFAEDRKLK